MNITAGPERFLSKAGVKNPKAVIYGGAAIVVVLIAVGIYLKIKKRNAGKYNIGRNYTEMTEELKNLDVSQSRLSLTDGEATLIAQNLFAAMNQWGTDEKAIIDGLSRAQTADDLYLIIQKFGIKPYDGLGLSDTFLSNQFSAVMKNLSGWLRSELSGSNLRAVKAIYENLKVPF